MSNYSIIIAGCGHMANVWASYALQREDATIVGLVDLYPDAAAKFAQNHNLSCPIFTNLAEAIHSTGANIVFDVTVPASHYEIASTALSNGCHVFAEKPLAESITQCVELVQLAQKTKRTHAVMQNRRFDPKIRSLRKLIEDKKIGDIGFVSADFFIGPHFGGFRDMMASPLLLDMSIHTFDQARYITGANPVSVYCHEFNPPGSWYKGNAMAVCIFEMSDGSVFDYRGSWCSEGVPTSWEASWRVSGSKGTAIWDGQRMPYAEIVSSVDQQGKFIYDYEEIVAEEVTMENVSHHGCLDNMFDALQNNILPETSSSDNLYSMAMVLAAIESSRTKTKVNIKDFLTTR